MNESIINASWRVGDWCIPTSVWQVSICVGERGGKTIHRRRLAQISILLHILGRPLKFCRKFHSEDGWMETGAESIFQRTDFFFAYSLSHEHKQMNPGNYGGAVHSFTDSPGEGHVWNQAGPSSSSYSATFYWGDLLSVRLFFTLLTWNNTIHQNGLLWGLDKVMYVKYVIQPWTY